MKKTNQDKPEFTYEQAKSALDKIIKDIQNENLSIDLLAEKIKQAQELITYCQMRLRNIESEVRSLIGDEEE